MSGLVTSSMRLALILISWLGCAAVIGTAYRELPVLVSVGETLVVHARFEQALARQELER